MIIIMVLCMLLVFLLFKKEMTNFKYLNNFSHENNISEYEYNEQKTRDINEKLIEATCPNCNNYHPKNYKGILIEPRGLNSEIHSIHYKCDNCGLTWIVGGYVVEKK